jgi:hypothetical protein
MQFANDPALASVSGCQVSRFHEVKSRKEEKMAKSTLTQDEKKLLKTSLLALVY